MKINREILVGLESKTKELKYETGGIIGSKGDGIITDIIFDFNENQSHPCSYSPNTAYLNASIEQWCKENIQFCGIFHTHFCNVKSLSCGDKKYIYEILKSMPDNVKSLYFPIYILPSRDLIPYLAYIDNNELCIKEETIEIID